MRMHTTKAKVRICLMLYPARICLMLYPGTNWIHNLEPCPHPLASNLEDDEGHGCVVDEIPNSTTDSLANNNFLLVFTVGHAWIWCPRS
jgi:hypothetical protein